MSIENPEISGEEEGKTWAERFAEAAESARALLDTRLQIFREEASAKAAFAAKGVLAIAIAATLGFGALLLLAALLSAVFAQLFGNVALGILAAVVVYAAGTAAAGWFGWKAMTRVKPTEFPATTGELSEDWKAVRAALTAQAEPDENASGSGDQAIDERDVQALEQRLRVGSE
jgi:hypothetical protein